MQARDTISANTYLNEDVQCIAKRNGAVGWDLGLKMLRNPTTVAHRLCDPVVVPQDGGAVTAKLHVSRLAPKALRATRVSPSCTTPP